MSDDINKQPSTTAVATSSQSRKSPQFRVIYSNIFQYRVAINDITVIFGTMADIGESPRSLVTTEEALVIMSVGQAKALAEYLTLIVNRYELEFGRVQSVGSAPPSPSELDGMFSVLKNVGVH